MPASEEVLEARNARRAKRVEKERKGEDKNSPMVRLCTINLHKRLHGVTFKKRAARAVKEIKKFATQHMRTKEVRIDATLNKFVWHKGIRNVPTRVRVRLERQRNDDEDAADKMLTIVTYVDVKPTRRNEHGPSGFKKLSNSREES